VRGQTSQEANKPGGETERAKQQRGEKARHQCSDPVGRATEIAFHCESSNKSQKFTFREWPNLQQIQQSRPA